MLDESQARHARHEHLKKELKTTWFFAWLLFLGGLGLLIAALFLWDGRYLIAAIIIFVAHEAAHLNEKKVLDMLEEMGNKNA